MEKADVPISIEFFQLACLVLLNVKVFNVSKRKHFRHFRF